MERKLAGKKSLFLYPQDLFIRFIISFVLNTFVSYTGINVPDRLAIEVETILDSGAHVARAFFRNEEGQSGMNKTFDLAKNQQLNSSVYVYIPVRQRERSQSSRNIESAL
jgi:hypothetical protein